MPQIRPPSSLRRAVNLLPRSCRSIQSRRSHGTSSTTQGANSSVDATEVTHFDALASTWWDPHGSSRLLHLMNPLRHDFISSSMSSQNPHTQPTKSLTYLDVGCGGGIFAESAARLPTTKSVTAIDPSAPVIAIAREHARRDPALRQPSYTEHNSTIDNSSPPNLTYLNTDIDSFATPNLSKQPTPQFDVVTLFEVLEHVNRPSDFLTSALPFVKPGGWLVLSTIARTWTSWFTTKLVAEDLVGLVPRGTHDWNKYVLETELRAWFSKSRELRRVENDEKSEGLEWSTAKRRSGAGAEEWDMRSQGVIYVPGIGWRAVDGGEQWGNYFFGVRRKPLTEGV
ncbi:MAG: hypothetical protein M4579_002783 [Chaenotheca gracillima]|nr:MAG: hypothetical protein M4579_002783 [Chaenotheca gracillima]